MSEVFCIVGINLAAVVCLMLVGWIASLAMKNVTIVDSLWGLGFVIIAWITFFAADGWWFRKMVITLLTTVWGIRLALHLARRNWNKPEDSRYATWRVESGGRFWFDSLYNVFILQAAVLWGIALVVQYGQIPSTPAHVTAWDLIGIFFWMIGFGFEALADEQLYRFKSNPENAGKVFAGGLWAWSRHPNYFGECLVWWGIFFVTASTPFSFWTIISPVLITLVLLKMTGIPLTEETLLRKKPEYSDYIRRTRPFVPWFPKNR